MQLGKDCVNEKFTWFLLLDLFDNEVEALQVLFQCRVTPGCALQGGLGRGEFVNYSTQHRLRIWLILSIGQECRSQILVIDNDRFQTLGDKYCDLFRCSRSFLPGDSYEITVEGAFKDTHQIFKIRVDPASESFSEDMFVPRMELVPQTLKSFRNVSDAGRRKIHGSCIEKTLIVHGDF